MYISLPQSKCEISELHVWNLHISVYGDDDAGKKTQASSR